MATKKKTANKRRSNPKRKGRKKGGPLLGIAAFTGTGTDSTPGFNFAQLASIKWIKRFIGILLAPICWISLESLCFLFRSQDTAYWLSPEFVSFVLGSAFWLVLFFGARSRFMMWLYVAGHEITHAIFVLICRGNVAKVHISSGGGHVLTNRNNFLISLSPYFFPFYTAIIIVIWAVLDWQISGFGQNYINWLYGLIGFSWTFHITFTLWMIRRDQPDVDQNGRIFSFTVISLANILIIATLLIVASPTATFRDFARSFVANAESLGSRLLESTQEMWMFLLSFLPV